MKRRKNARFIEKSIILSARAEFHIDFIIQSQIYHLEILLVKIKFLERTCNRLVWRKMLS